MYSAFLCCYASNTWTSFQFVSTLHFNILKKIIITTWSYGSNNLHVPIYSLLNKIITPKCMCVVVLYKSST